MGNRKSVSKIWRKARLEELADITSSKRIYLSDYVKHGVPFFRSKEIIEKHENQKNSTELYISEKKFEKIKKTFGVPIENDLLLTSVGTIGIPYLVKKDDYFYFKDGNLIWLRSFRGCDSKFIYYWLESRFGKEAVNSIIIGSSQSAITIIGLKNLEIFIPEGINEQKRIASILSAFDDKIELNNKISQNLEQTAQAIFEEWFMDGKKLKGWRVEKIGDIAKVVLGGTPSRLKKEYWGGDIPWINSGKVNEFRIISASENITDKGLKKSNTQLMPSRTTVIAITGATLGQVSLLEIEACANQSVVGIFGSELLSPEFIYLFIKNKILEIILEAGGGAQQHINKKIVENYPIFIPSPEINLKFNKIVKPIFDEISKNIFENQKLAVLRDLLLPKLMSGEIDL